MRRAFICSAAWPRWVLQVGIPQALHQQPPGALRCISAVESLRKASSSSSPVHTPPFPSLNEIDQKWQSVWQTPSQWTPKTTSKGKYYVLPMFPYPSGALHIGHLRVYTISDVLARYRRMCGHDVLHTIGWDAFGLPAENAAIERGIDPEKWTMDNISKMRGQIMSMGGCWNWERELMTCDPSFYKDTQKLFLRLYEAGLAYQAEAEVNYDPIDRTVLANEQVDSNGVSWRSGAKVEKRSLKQWFLKITAYKEALLEDMAALEASHSWPQHVLNMQKNWLGRSQGANIRFGVSGVHAGSVSEIEVFTTRPDTLFGVQYLAISFDHPLVAEAAKKSTGLAAFIKQNKDNFSPDLNMKAGFVLDGVTAANPLSGLSDAPDFVKQPLPIFVAPYVVSGYGTGAVMGVPAHDARDFAFWQRHRPGDLPRRVVDPLTALEAKLDSAYTEHGVLNAQCATFANLTSEEGGAAIIQALSSLKGKSANLATQWRLRDWLISRQRYWGAPIPIIHCDSCGPQPVPHSDLPVQLPRLSEQQLKSSQGNPLESTEEWVNANCPKCNSPAKRETDTMDTFVDSSWYYLHFAQGALEPLSPQSEVGNSKKYMPVDVYVGGVEHAILHLLYARFIHKFTRERAGASADISPEPFQRLLAQGMVHGPTYTAASTNRIVKPSEVDLSNPSKPVTTDGQEVKVRWEKMSKSKHNGVDPMACLARYGADATRAHLLFSAPVEDVLEWDEAKIVGVERWFARVWTLVSDPRIASYPSKQSVHATKSSLQDERGTELWESVQETIRSVNKSFSETYSLNTVVSDLMQLTNTLLTHAKSLSSSSSSSSSSSTESRVLYKGASALVRMMSPIAPSFAEEAWIVLHRGEPATRAFEAGFPEAQSHDIDNADGGAARKRMVVCAVQVNGKLKFTTTIQLDPFSASASSSFSASDFVSKSQGKAVGDAHADAGIEQAFSPAQQQQDEMKNEKDAAIIQQILASAEAQRFLFDSSALASSPDPISSTDSSPRSAAKRDIARAKRIIVVRGGRLVNFVF